MLRFKRTICRKLRGTAPDQDTSTEKRWHPGAEINFYSFLICSNNVYEIAFSIIRKS
ncbi:hypothetical protein HF072_11410 [Bacillus sp. RO3]|nr:hypothetical protein [Bacillus sp. RO3]